MVTLPCDLPPAVPRFAVLLLLEPARDLVAFVARALRALRLVADLRAPVRAVPLLLDVVREPPFARAAICFERPLLALLRALDFGAPDFVDAPARPFIARLLDELDFEPDLLRVAVLFLVEVVAILYHS